MSELSTIAHPAHACVLGSEKPSRLQKTMPVNQSRLLNIPAHLCA